VSSQSNQSNTLDATLVSHVHTVTDERGLTENALYNIVLTLLGILIDVN
jgi:hypothetical protein